MKRYIWVGYIAVCMLVVLAACGSNMRYQAKCLPGRPTTAFDDGSCEQQLPPNTVARAYVRDFFVQQAGGTPTSSYGALNAGNGPPPADIPFPVTRQVLDVGRNRYNIFCAPCHGIAGYGNGMIVQRGFPPPPSFHSPQLRQVPPGFIYDVITNGFGIMYSYAYRVPPEERWAIAAYIKALQLSQNASLSDVPPEQRQNMQGAQP